MSELEDKINSILGDPKQMEQITKVARSLMGGAGGESGGEAGGRAESALRSWPRRASPLSSC